MCHRGRAHELAATAGNRPSGSHTGESSAHQLRGRPAGPCCRVQGHTRARPPPLLRAALSTARMHTGLCIYSSITCSVSPALRPSTPAASGGTLTCFEVPAAADIDRALLRHLLQTRAAGRAPPSFRFLISPSPWKHHRFQTNAPSTLNGLYLSSKKSFSQNQRLLYKQLRSRAAAR